MEINDFTRFMTGLKKKHGDSFSLSIKYVTDSGKVRKRSGTYKELIDDEVLVLFNEKKRSTGRYFIDRIKHIEKSTNS